MNEINEEKRKGERKGKLRKSKEKGVKLREEEEK